MKNIQRCITGVSLTLLLAVTGLAEGEHPVANSKEIAPDNSKSAKKADFGDRHVTEQSGKGTAVGELMPLDAPDLRAHGTADPHSVKIVHPNGSLIGKIPSTPRPKTVFSTPTAAAAVHPVKSMPTLPAPPMASTGAASMKKSTSLPTQPMALAEAASLLKAENPHANSFPPPAPVTPALVRSEQKPVGETAFDHPGAPSSLRPGSALGGTSATMHGRAPALATIGGNNAGNGSKTTKSTASISGSTIR